MKRKKILKSKITGKKISVTTFPNVINKKVYTEVQDEWEFIGN